jgi:hypothetical protein
MPALPNTSAGKPPGLTFPAPFDALWSYRSRPETDLNVIKAARAAAVWRSNRGSKAAIQAGRYLGWILRFPRDLVRCLAVRGQDAKQRLGRSYPGQIADMVKVAAINGVMPRDYYAGDLARHGGREELFRYVPYHLHETVVRLLARERSANDAPLTGDKYAFERRCRDLGLPVVRTIAIAQPDKLCSATGERLVGVLPLRDFIAKPVNGGQGRDVERWRYVGLDRFANAQGEATSAEALISRLCRSSQVLGATVLLQECLVNHAELQTFSGSALSTARVTTTVNEQGEPEIVEAFFRTSVVPHASVDNLHSGGVLFPIDVATGRLTAGYVEARLVTDRIEKHPQTGAIVAGEFLPGWAVVSSLAFQAHKLLPGLLLVGWDIAYTPDGPVIVEANAPPGISVMRQGVSGPIAGTRYYSLLAFHARAWLAANEPGASRWRASGTHGPAER